MNLILNTLKLFKVLSEYKPTHCVEESLRDEMPETVKLDPKTLEQLDDAIKEAESQCIVSVVSLIAVSEVVEYRLVSSEQSDDVLSELCAKYIPDLTADDLEYIQGEGHFTTSFYHICAIHLDANGRYDPQDG